MNPRFDRFNVKSELPARVQKPERQNALFLHTGFLRIKLRQAVAGFGVEPHAQFGRDKELAGLLVGLTENQSRRFPFPPVARAWTREGDAEGLDALGFAAQVEGDDTVVVRL